MSTKDLDQDDPQSKKPFEVSEDISNIQSTKKEGNQRSQSKIIGISGGSVLIISIIAVTVWSGSRIFANSSQPTPIGSIPQATNVIANYCNALVKHNFPQAQEYILPNSSSIPDLLQQEVKDAEEQNQGPLVRCKIFGGKDAMYPKGKQFFVAVHQDGLGYRFNDPANLYTTKEVVSFQMNFLFQKPNSPTTYLTGSCQVLATSNQKWLIYGSCPMDECPIPGWKPFMGIGPVCLSPNVVGQPPRGSIVRTTQTP
jgi:hypothetical protein